MDEIVKWLSPLTYLIVIVLAFANLKKDIAVMQFQNNQMGEKIDEIKNSHLHELKDKIGMIEKKVVEIEKTLAVHIGQG